MSEITLSTINDIIVVDSRLLAEHQGTEHDSFVKLVKTHQVKLEAKFGCVRFQVGDIEMPNGGCRKGVTHALLTEDQALAILSLSRNTDRVVDLKFELVEKFQTQKRLLEDSTDRELRTVIYREQQKALPTRAELRPHIRYESELFSTYCHKNGHPVCQVHDYITLKFTGMTAKQLRDIGWVDGSENVGLNHIISLEKLLLVSTAKLHFARMKKPRFISENWSQRCDRAIHKALVGGV